MKELEDNSMDSPLGKLTMLEEVSHGVSDWNQNKIKFNLFERGIDCHTFKVDIKNPVEKNDRKIDSQLCTEVIDLIKSVIPYSDDYVVAMRFRWEFSLISKYGDAIIKVNVKEYSGTFPMYYSIQCFGKKEVCQSLASLHFDVGKTAYIDWYYSTSSGMNNKQFPFVFEEKVYNEHYPFLKEDIDDYFQTFKESDAPILLLMGPPGTGKSTFIKHYIRKNTSRAMLTHDEALLSSDGFLVSYFSDDQKDILIVEDADVMIKSREFAGNKIMAKLLNISDGVLKITKGKKLILSTNITQVSNIDEALMRPGRCFDVINFRPLLVKEANDICNLHGLQGFDPSSKEEYTLAEIFNQRKFTEKTKSEFGFRVVK